MRYPVTLTKDDNDTILVTFPDVPGAITYGDTKEEALRHAVDALETVFDAHMSDRRDIPTPSPARRHYVELPALVAAKVALYTTMRDSKVGKAELARRLKWHLPQVDRVLNVRHDSRLAQLESAFSVLGRKLDVTISKTETTSGRRRLKAVRTRQRAAEKAVAR